MATGQYKQWREKENLLLLRGWKRDGLTNDQIAEKIGISRKTLYVWIKKYSDIGDALKIGKEHANFAVENKLFQKAISGNVTAMIFYLKNNWRSKYTDNTIDPELKKYQIAKAKAEAEIARYNAELLNGAIGDDKVVIVDDIPDEQSD